MPYERDSNQRPPLPGAGQMEDYTTPFLVIAGMLCFAGLFAIWAVFGLPFTLVLALLTDRFVISR